MIRTNNKTTTKLGALPTTRASSRGVIQRSPTDPNAPKPAPVFAETDFPPLAPASKSATPVIPQLQSVAITPTVTVCPVVPQDDVASPLPVVAATQLESDAWEAKAYQTQMSQFEEEFEQEFDINCAQDRVIAMCEVYLGVTPGFLYQQRAHFWTVGPAVYGL